MASLEYNARLILTDSGGIQKEAMWLGVPCVTLRDETEWIETIKVGWNILVGVETQKIIHAVKSFDTPFARFEVLGNEPVLEIVNLLKKNSNQ